MSWTEIKQAHQRLLDCVKEGRDPSAAWRDFSALAGSDPDQIPYHMQSVFRLLEEIAQRKPIERIAILDHGCGGCLTLMYLLANGYSGIHGVDIRGKLSAWQSFLSEHIGLKDLRLAEYDGTALPFDDASFDLVFSEQVIEHVRPDVLEHYYREERRVLRPGGIAFHRVPHRLTPYDSHTRTWFLHYLPRFFWLRCLRLIGRSSITAETALFLRWPWIHRRLIRRYLGNLEDQTLDRFTRVTDLSHYEGPKGLRRRVAGLLKVPVIGFFARIFVRNISMIDTVSRRST